MDTVLATMRRGAMPKLPYDAEVEYAIKANYKSGCLEIPFKATEKTAYELKVKNIDRSSSRNVFGARDSATVANVANTFNTIDFGNYSQTRFTDTSLAIGDVVVIKNSATERSFSVNGGEEMKSERQYVDAPFVGSNNVFLGGINGQGTEGLEGYYYYVKIWDDGVLLFDLIPVRVGEQAYWFNRVTMALMDYSSAFAVGPDKQTYTQSLGVLMPQKDAEPTARDYVQDGLIAMWDGIENAGWGVHDSAATVWKDLVGSKDVSLPATSFFEDDFLDHKTNTVWSKVSADAITIEIIAACYDENLSGNPRFFSEAVGLRSELDTQSGTVVNFTYANYASVLINRSIHQSVNAKNTNAYSCVLQKGGVPVLYVNNTSTTLTGDNRIVSDTILNSTQMLVFGRNGAQMHGKIYSIRQYAKALTAAEISHNYAIDKARFKLT